MSDTQFLFRKVFSLVLEVGRWSMKDVARMRLVCRAAANWIDREGRLSIYESVPMDLMSMFHEAWISAKPREDTAVPVVFPAFWSRIRHAPPVRIYREDYEQNRWLNHTLQRVNLGSFLLPNQVENIELHGVENWDDVPQMAEYPRFSLLTLCGASEIRSDPLIFESDPEHLTDDEEDDDDPDTLDFEAKDAGLLPGVRSLCVRDFPFVLGGIPNTITELTLSGPTTCPVIVRDSRTDPSRLWPNVSPDRKVLWQILELDSVPNLRSLDFRGCKMAWMSLPETCKLESLKLPRRTRFGTELSWPDTVRSLTMDMDSIRRTTKAEAHGHQHFPACLEQLHMHVACDDVLETVPESVAKFCAQMYSACGWLPEEFCPRFPDGIQEIMLDNFYEVTLHGNMMHDWGSHLVHVHIDSQENVQFNFRISVARHLLTLFIHCTTLNIHDDLDFRTPRSLEHITLIGRELAVSKLDMSRSTRLTRMVFDFYRVRAKKIRIPRFEAVQDPSLNVYYRVVHSNSDMDTNMPYKLEITPNVCEDGAKKARERNPRFQVFNTSFHQ